MKLAQAKKDVKPWEAKMGVAYFLKNGELYEGTESEMEEGQYFFVLSQTPTTPMNYEFVFMRRGKKKNNGEYDWYENKHVYSSIDVEDFHYMYFRGITDGLKKLQSGKFFNQTI